METTKTPLAASSKLGRLDELFVVAWGRRLVTVSLYVVLGLLWLASLPVTLLATLAVDLTRGGLRRRARTRALAFFGLYLMAEWLGVIAALGLGALTLGGRLVGPARYVALNAALQRAWTGALFHGSVWLFAMRVEVEGLEHARQGPLLLFVRHTSTADTVLAAALVANPHRLLLRYVLKRELLWDPCLDLVGTRLPNAFVDRHSSDSRSEVDAVAQLASGLDGGSAALIYPEGTRFEPAKLVRSVEKLRELGLPHLAAIAKGYRQVLPPRLGGPLALLDAAPGVDVAFLEHTGFEGAATFASFWGGGLVGQTVRVRVRRFAAVEIPRTGRDTWLFQRWAELDEWVCAAGS